MEKDRELHDFLGGRYSSAPRFETYSFFPLSMAGIEVPACRAKTLKLPRPSWSQFLDELGVHTTVLYPTGGLALGLIQNPEWACVLARAYNSWIAERFTQVRARGLKALRCCQCTSRSKQRRNSSGRKNWALSPDCCRQSLVAEGLRTHGF